MKLVYEMYGEEKQYIVNNDKIKHGFWFRGNSDVAVEVTDKVYIENWINDEDIREEYRDLQEYLYYEGIYHKRFPDNTYNLYDDLI